MTKKRVLIVENEGITAMEEAVIMRELGHEVTGIALSGESAIEQAGRDKPDVVLMDIMLSDRTAGDEAAMKIWQWYKIPVIFLTAVGNKAMSKAENFKVPEGFGYIVKPYTKEELKSEIERLCMGPGIFS